MGKTLCMGRSNIILVGVLVGLKKSNLLHGKTLHLDKTEYIYIFRKQMGSQYI
jgi:hypothetical protein